MDEKPEHRALVQKVEEIWKLSELPRDAAPPARDYVKDDWDQIYERIVSPDKHPEHRQDASASHREERSRSGPLNRGGTPREAIHRDPARRDAAHHDQSGKAGSHASLRPPVARELRSRRPEGWRRHRREGASFSIGFATVLVLVLIAGGLFVAILNHSGGSLVPTAAAERVAVTGAGQRGQLTLSDGTRVQLNVRSRLEYPRSFGASLREVRLSGEAFFEVTSDPSRPFIVHTNGATVRVRGTSFGVRAYDAEDAVKVVVVEGAVDLSVSGIISGEREKVSLTKDELATVVGGRLGEVIPNVDPSRYLGWQEGRLIFEDTPLRQVAVELENWYDLSIRITDEQLARRTLTATFENEPTDVVLQVIATALEANFERNGPNVVFYLHGTPPAP